MEQQQQRYVSGVELDKPAYVDCNFNWTNIDMSPDEGVYQGNFDKNKLSFLTLKVLG